MSAIQVLLDEKGTILGTASPAATAAGDAPKATLVARPGQQVVEVTLTDAEARLDADKLMTTLHSKHLSHS